MNQPTPISCQQQVIPHWRQKLPLPLLEAALILTWSSGFVGARFSMDYAPPLLVVFWRCVVVTLILFPFVARQLRQTSPAVLLKNAGIGLLAMAGYLAGVPRLHIPSLRFADGPPGLLTRVPSQAETATMGVAATFSVADAEANGRVIGKDARALGIDVCLQPFINIDRDITFGRRGLRFL